MHEPWRATRISALAEIFDGPHATPEKSEVGPWFLSISSLRNGRLILSESSHVSTEVFRQWTRRVTPRAGDVLFSYETRLGEAALMPDGVQACLGRRMALLRPRREVVDPAFLLYSYLGPAFQAMIQRRAIRGATVDRIPLNQVGGWNVDLPAIAVQRAIAAVLKSVDDKMDANAVLVGRASSLARAHLCFVTQRAPSRPLASVAVVRKGLSYKGSGLADIGMPMVNLANAARFGGFKREGFKHYTGAYQPRHVAHGGDLLVANTDLTWKLEALGYPMLLPDDVPEALFSHHMSIIDFADALLPGVMSGRLRVREAEDAVSEAV